MMPTELSAVLPARHIHEECGVFGVYTPETADVASLAYYALYALQHRGQESAGIAVNDDGVFTAYRDVGLVNDVFPAERLRSLGTGTIAVGHVRYGTTGSDNKRNVQPILVNHYKGRMALAHNGNLTNSHALRQELESQGYQFEGADASFQLLVRKRLKPFTPFFELLYYHIYTDYSDGSDRGASATVKVMKGTAILTAPRAWAPTPWPTKIPSTTL